jgi:hypothetical protein
MKQPRAERDQVARALEKLATATRLHTEAWYQAMVAMVTTELNTNPLWQKNELNGTQIIAEVLANTVHFLTREACGNIGPENWQACLNAVGKAIEKAKAEKEAMGNIAEQVDDIAKEWGFDK